MATARERLWQALLSIIGQAYSEAGSQSLKRLLNTYRVQVKRGEQISKDGTARNILADTIIAKWRAGAVLSKADIVELIAPFRMQLKAGLTRGRITPAIQQNTDAELTNQAGLTRSQIKKNILQHENAYFKKKQNSSSPDACEPIAGGPQPKTGTRELCPKCRSFGIVLARAYDSEDLLSCIYCGYQAYLNDENASTDLPFAAKFLGDAFDEPDLDKE